MTADISLKMQDDLIQKAKNPYTPEKKENTVRLGHISIPLSES